MGHLAAVACAEPGRFAVADLKAAAGQYADAVVKCLPGQEFKRVGKKWVTLPGCYYTRRPVTAKTNKALFTAALNLKVERQPSRTWSGCGLRHTSWRGCRWR